jgi:uncharacterized membrane protein
MAVVLPVALVLLWATLAAFEGGALGKAIADRGVNWLTAVFFGMGLSVCLAASLKVVVHADVLESRSGPAGLKDDPPRADIHNERAVLVPVLAMMATGMLLIFGAELFYIEDLFGTRLNTVFKLYYQAWLLLGASGAFGAYWLWRWQPVSDVGRTLRGSWSGVAALVLIGAMLYPVGATLSRTDGLARPGRTLDGLAYARDNVEGGDYKIASWLQRRAGAGERLIEAAGEQYSEAGRIATWSGVPGVLGWAGHEAQWGRDGGMLGARRADVDQAYRTVSLAEALAILQKYDVSYVVVSRLERQKYSAEGLDKFEAGLPAALRLGQSVLYRVPRGDDAVGPDVKLAP